MSATPEPSSVSGRKRPIDEVSASDQIRERDVLRKNIMTVLSFNRDLFKFKAATITELKLKKNVERSLQTSHEFVLIDIVSDPDGREFLLYLLRHESFSVLTALGCSRSRGDVTIHNRIKHTKLYLSTYFQHPSVQRLFFPYLKPSFSLCLMQLLTDYSFPFPQLYARKLALLLLTLINV